MTKLSLAELQPNDLVRVSRVYRVLVEPAYYYGSDYAVVQDEKNGDRVEIYDDGGTQVIELLHRPRKKPTDGDVLTPDEVVKTQWKRGTVLQNTNTGSVLSLMPDGTWVNTSRGFAGITFRELHHADAYGDKFRVLHVVK